MKRGALKAFPEKFDQNVRLIILKALAEEDNRTLSDAMLMYVFETFVISKDKAYLVEQLEWLEEKDAVILREAGTSVIATLTAAGRLHLKMITRIPGIDAPSQPVDI